jgi:hypothetical protein
MGFASQATNQKFPFPYDYVFDGLVFVLPHVGMQIVKADKLIGRITAKTGMTLFSYGENVTLIVERIDAAATGVRIESSLKVGFNVAGADRHARNFEKIITALSTHLQPMAQVNDAARVPMCPRCQAPLAQGQPFCRQCGMAINWQATSSPGERG